MLSKYLKLIILFVTGMITGTILTAKKVKTVLNVIQINTKKDRLLSDMLRQWLVIKIEEKKIENYLNDKGYYTIAVYGMNFVGDLLIKELASGNIKVEYGIDKRAKCIEAEVKMLEPDSDLPEVDAIVVTAVTYFDEIKSSLSKKVQCPVISLEECLYGLL